MLPYCIRSCYTKDALQYASDELKNNIEIGTKAIENNLVIMVSIKIYLFLITSTRCVVEILGVLSKYIT